MKTANCAAMPVKGQALLRDLGIEAVRRKLLSAPGAREETAFVFSRLYVDQPCVPQSGHPKDHSKSPLPALDSSGRQ